MKNNIATLSGLVQGNIVNKKSFLRQMYNNLPTSKLTNVECKELKTVLKTFRNLKLKGEQADFVETYLHFVVLTHEVRERIKNEKPVSFESLKWLKK